MEREVRCGGAVVSGEHGGGGPEVALHGATRGRLCGARRAWRTKGAWQLIRRQENMKVAEARKQRGNAPTTTGGRARHSCGWLLPRKPQSQWVASGGDAAHPSPETVPTSTLRDVCSLLRVLGHQTLFSLSYVPGLLFCQFEQVISSRSSPGTSGSISWTRVGSLQCASGKAEAHVKVQRFVHSGLRLKKSWNREIWTSLGKLRRG